MDELANRLMLRGQGNSATTPTAIFGTAGTLSQTVYTSRPSIRIGLWPLKSQDSPLMAMGIFAVLGYLLDQYGNTNVYRLVARLDNSDTENYQWDISKSQFDPDDWQIDQLDDNIGFWGNLEQREQNWVLKVNLENDLSDDEELETFQCEAASLAGIVRELPDFVADIAKFLDIEPKLISANYDQDNWEEDLLKQALESVFNWELKLYLHLWGIPWQEAQMRSDLIQLQTATQLLGSLGTWLITNSILRVMMFTDIELEVWLLPIIQDLISQSNFTDIIAPLIGTALFESQQTEAAYDLLENVIENETENPLTYLALAELYRRGGRIVDAIDTYQDAIENDCTSIKLYRRYADTLIAMDYNNLDHDTVVFVDPAEHADNTLLREAIEAYQSALDLDPIQTDLLVSQLLQLIDLDPEDSRFWPNFKLLVEAENSAAQVRTVVDSLYSLEDLQPAIEILSQQINNTPGRADLYINLAIIDTFEDESEHAHTMLQRARELTNSEDHETIADIDYLTLMIEEPELEAHLGEITQIIDAGNNLETSDVAFLESILEQAPRIAEAYILLAKAYIGWGENASALETLLDGHKQLPDDPDILALLCESLWESGEQDLSLSYLSKGLANNPGHVPLLARAGLYLFEDGQEEAARMYLTKAEMINPRDPTLAQVRVQIARNFSK